MAQTAEMAERFQAVAEAMRKCLQELDALDASLPANYLSMALDVLWRDYISAEDADARQHASDWIRH